MPKLQFHPDIASEVKASYNWYQAQADGLGDDFIAELESAYDTIVDFLKRGLDFRRASVDICSPNSPFL